MEPLHYLLMKTQSQLHRQIMAQAADLGLSPGQPKILECLTECGECNQKTIARYCEIEQATVGSILLRMEEGGLILRRQKEGNRRSLYVSLTDQGMEAAEKLRDIFRNMEEEATRGLSQEEVETLKSMLWNMCMTMETKGRKM